MPPALSVTGTVGVQRHDHAGQREHGGGRDADAVDAMRVGDLVGDDDADGDHDGRYGGRLHGHREALDHIRGVAGFRRLGHRADGAVRRRGVVLGHPDDEGGDRETDDARTRNRRGRRRRKGSRVTKKMSTADINGRCDEALVERAHNALAFAQADEEGASDGREDA